MLFRFVHCLIFYHYHHHYLVATAVFLPFLGGYERTVNHAPTKFYPYILAPEFVPDIVKCALYAITKVWRSYPQS